MAKKKKKLTIGIPFRILGTDFSRAKVRQSKMARVSGSATAPRHQRTTMKRLKKKKLKDPESKAQKKAIIWTDYMAVNER